LLLFINYLNRQDGSNNSRSKLLLMQVFSSTLTSSRHGSSRLSWQKTTLHQPPTKSSPHYQRIILLPRASDSTAAPLGKALMTHTKHTSTPILKPSKNNTPSTSRNSSCNGRNMPYYSGTTVSQVMWNLFSPND
jgi:hypothetical protein